MSGLILSEGIWPSREAVGAAWVPGLFSDAQVEGWRHVTGAVHAAGGRIVAQFGHTGGASHLALLDGNLPLAPSAVSLNQPVFTGTLENSPVPQAMMADDIARTIDAYCQATGRARKAGFDGVELHGTVGYLIPQFLNDGFNQREDHYGGSIENRTRFPLEVLEAMIAAWTPGRIGLKLSPALGMG